MYKITFTLCFVILLLFSSNIFSQHNNQPSAGVAPWLPGTVNIIPNPSAYYYNATTTGFAYSASGSNCQLFRFKVGTPGIVTLIGSVQAHFLGNGDFANPTGVWKFYVQEQLTSPYTIYEVDTATGVLTSVGAPLNLKPGHMPIDMEWDHTTNTMYMVSANNTLTETQFYSMYWPTKTLTWIGTPVTTPAAIIAGGFNANGTYFGIDMASDALWRVNKNTGIWTQIGPVGYNVNYGQDAGFDRSDFSKMLWSACGSSTIGLYEVDTATGASTLIGAYPTGYTQVLATGFVAANGPQISHTPLPNTTNLAGPYVVNATIFPAGSGIVSSKVYWSRNNLTVTDSVTMTNTSGNDWLGNIPGNGAPASYKYYIWTKDALNRVSTAPVNAPSSLYTFIAMATDTVKPVITHTPISDPYDKDWPVTVSALVTDNLGIDSVWVRWTKNNSITKRFKLLNTSGNIYSAAFNTVLNEVLPGDSIRYRIIAQDNSPQHNKDSTISYGFKVLLYTYTCIGTGTVQMSNGSPFNTYWWGTRTQMLYKASEIIASGGMQGVISGIGFNIYSASSQVMNGFNINIQNYPSSTLSGFENSNWTNVYYGTYAITGTGWKYLSLPSPYFYWDGVSNLLIEICFSNSAYTVASVVLGTSMANMEYSEYHDQPNACLFSAPTAISSRPNICIEIQDVTGVSPVIGIPSEYKLSQNYPNPFNPVTRISFDIPKQGFVSLKIYDVLGREVKSLVSEVKSPGSYSVDFNATGLSSGLYLYRLESNGFIDTKRMVLIK